MIVIDEQGKIFAKKEYLYLLKRKCSKHLDYFGECSSDDDEDLNDIDEISHDLVITPEKKRR